MPPQLQQELPHFGSTHQWELHHYCKSGWDCPSWCPEIQQRRPPEFRQANENSAYSREPPIVVSNLRMTWAMAATCRNIVPGTDSNKIYHTCCSHKTKRYPISPDIARRAPHMIAPPTIPIKPTPPPPVSTLPRLALLPMLLPPSTARPRLEVW